MMVTAGQAVQVLAHVTEDISHRSFVHIEVDGDLNLLEGLSHHDSELRCGGCGELRGGWLVALLAAVWQRKPEGRQPGMHCRQ